MPSPLTREDVKKVALLARLKLSESEVEALTAQLGQILEYVELLNELDTKDVEPIAHVADLRDVFRDDVICESLPRDAALQNAPKTDGQFFLVPQILEGG